MEKQKKHLKDQEIMNNKSSEIDGLKELRKICEKGYKNGKNVKYLREELRFKNPSEKGTHPNHKKCAAYYKECDTENREKSICRCMFYYDENKQKCKESCKFKRKWHHLDSDGIQINDYETPMEFKIDGIGNIDLLIKYKDEEYGVEVKPPEGNEETISRMISEAMTYTIDFPYKPAIAVFGPSSYGNYEGSYQYKRVIELENDENFKIIREYVKVFVITMKAERELNTGIVVDFIIEPFK